MALSCSLPRVSPHSAGVLGHSARLPCMLHPDLMGPCCVQVADVLGHAGIGCLH